MGILGVAVALNITYTSNFLVQEYFVLVYKKNELLVLKVSIKKFSSIYSNLEFKLSGDLFFNEWNNPSYYVKSQSYLNIYNSSYGKKTFFNFFSTSFTTKLHNFEVVQNNS